MQHRLVRSIHGRLLIILFLLFPYSFSLGDQEISLTVINRTHHYLHVIINNESNLYVAPGRSASHESSTGGIATIYAEAFYAPAQGVEGWAGKSFQLGAVRSIECHSSSSSSCASSTEPDDYQPSVSPYARWEVFPGTLSGDSVTAAQTRELPR